MLQTNVTSILKKKEKAKQKHTASFIDKVLL